MTADEKQPVIVQVKVNGQTIPMKGFIQEMIGYSVLGMLKSLKDVPANPEEVDIKIKTPTSR
ncbi:MAG: hypothetical protein WC980_06105 [Candidatus Brocadiia bacterium]